jgi:predicted ATP-grasp superfamily ATP-dependent carboligase
MNVLITNTQEDQAYLILRCLREHAERIFVTVSDESLARRWAGMSAWSRHVRKRYRVPEFSADWRAGIVQQENTPAEERYIRRIEEICALERIDCVFPSYDADVYVFSKNRARLAQRGVTAVAPDFEGLARILDKSVTLAAAERVGFPTPRTCIPTHRDELAEAARELGPPWVLKPRCDAHAVNIRLASDRDELFRLYDQLNAAQERPLVQEFIPAASKQNYYLVVRPGPEVVSLITFKVHRLRRTGLQMPCAAVESTRDLPFEAEIRALIGQLDVWGGMTLQTVVDARDGQPKLLEINPRLGRNLWFRTELGINEPLMYLRIAQGAEPGPVQPISEGVLLLDPLADLLHLLGQSVDQSAHWLRTRLSRAGETRGNPFGEKPVRALARDMRNDYFGARRTLTSPLGRGFASDPLPPSMRVVRSFYEALRRRAG